MKRLPPEKDECIHQTVDRGIINSATEFHGLHAKCGVAEYFYTAMTLLAEKIYEVAPSCEEAEELFGVAINEAKEKHLEK